MPKSAETITTIQVIKVVKLTTLTARGGRVVTQWWLMNGTLLFEEVS